MCKLYSFTAAIFILSLFALGVLTAQTNNVLDLESIAKDYQDNAVNADLLYKNKTIVFRGRVLDVRDDQFNRNMAGKVQLESTAYSGGNNWFCAFTPSDMGAFSTLRKGDDVVLKGRYESFLNFSHCQVVHQQEHADADELRRRLTPLQIYTGFAFHTDADFTVLYPTKQTSTDSIEGICIKGRGTVRSVARLQTTVGSTRATIEVQGKTGDQKLSCALDPTAGRAIMDLDQLSVGNTVLVDGCSYSKIDLASTSPHIECILRNLSLVMYYPRYNWDPLCSAKQHIVPDSGLDKYCREDSK